jgi:LPXTG-motif cell wall-anchored protein
MESVETILYWLIGIGLLIMLSGVVVMRLQKKKD